MAAADSNAVYVNMMADALKRKLEVLEFIYDRTKRQEALLVDDDMDTDVFMQIIKEKNTHIDELTRIDEGFDRLFHYVEAEIQKNKNMYKEQIQQMQNNISAIVELGVQIQALEQQNNEHFEMFLAKKRSKIRSFHEGSRTLNKYYQSASVQKSYFFDQKK